MSELFLASEMEGGPLVGGPSLFGKYSGELAKVPDPERFTVANYEFFRLIVDHIHTFVQCFDLH